MPVKKTTRECYEVREDKPHGEWANITLSCWSRPTSHGTYYCGEITIQSSYGTWGHIWTACGEPFKQFLQDAEFGYVFTKFMGTKLHEFDGDKSARGLREKIIEHRRHGWLGKADARALWDRFEACQDEATRGDDRWVDELREAADDLQDDGHNSAARMLDEPWELIRESPVCSAVNFWQKLWPIFIAALAEETQAEAVPA